MRPLATSQPSERCQWNLVFSEELFISFLQDIFCRCTAIVCKRVSCPSRAQKHTQLKKKPASRSFHWIPSHTVISPTMGELEKRVKSSPIQCSVLEKKSLVFSFCPHFYNNTTKTKITRLYLYEILLKKKKKEAKKKNPLQSLSW